MRAALPTSDLDLVLSLTPEFWSRFGGGRVFVTGGTGFIGSWLVQVFQRANDVLGSQMELVILSRDPERARKAAPRVYARMDTRLVAGDVSRFSADVGHLDLCVHAATDVGDPDKMLNPLQVFDSIASGTRRVLDFAATAGACRFLLTSSGAVYGVQPPQLDRMPETYTGAPDPLSPNAAYGNGKRAAEWLAAAYASEAARAGFEACIARIFALIGPGLPFDGPFAAGNFIRDAIGGGGAIHVRGDGRPLRSYLYMADLCVWLLRILGQGATGQAYNVGSEEAISVEMLARQIGCATGAGIAVQIQSSSGGQGDAPRYIPDTTKARTALGLAEYTPLSTALLKTVQWSRTSDAL